MNKQEKFLLLVVLIVSGVGATLYVQNEKNKTLTTGLLEQVQVVSQSSEATKSRPGIQVEAPGSPQPAMANTAVPAAATPSAAGTIVKKDTQAVSDTKRISVAYQVPGNKTETLNVNVITTGGLISDISFSASPTTNESAEYYQSFTKKFQKGSLIGKPVSGATLARTGGASLTTNAFNRALGQL